jgi:hypothetical protein
LPFTFRVLLFELIRLPLFPFLQSSLPLRLFVVFDRHASVFTDWELP